MELSVLERLVLLGLLPAEGDILTLRIVQKLRSDLSFSEQDLADYQLVSEDGKVTWSDKATTPKDVTIGPKAQDLIRSALTALSDAKKLQPQHLALYDRFVEAEE